MRRRLLVGAAFLVSAVAVACGGGGGHGADADGSGQTSASAPAASRAFDPNAPLTDAERARVSVLTLNLPFTDFTKRTVDLTEIVSGGPPPDGIPAIRDPQFIDFAAANEWLEDLEPVISLEIDGDARAYPLQILTWHEIVDDTVGGRPVIVTFCPLCNTALTFDRTVDGAVLSFTTSGLLRRSDLIMIDFETGSLWQQITGEAIVGENAGTRLEFISSPIVSYAAFKETFPDGRVLSRDTGFVRRYGVNPYAGYDTIGSSTIFRVNEFDDGRLDAKERVLTVEIDGDAVAFPFSELTEHVVLETDVAGQVVVAFWQPGTLSPLDESFIIGSANVGAAAAYSPIVDGERLTFEARGQEIVDTQTGSVWNVLGLAVSGPMEGTMLEPVLSANHFWFSWSVFQPETLVIRGSG